MRVVTGLGLCLGYLWMTPHVLFGLLLLVVAKSLGWMSETETYRGGVAIRLRGIFAERMNASGWYGHTIGPFMFFYRLPWDHHLRHEYRHVQQQFVFGPLQPLLYVLCSLYYVIRRRSFAVAYFENPFERDARRAAGEEV